MLLLFNTTRAHTPDTQVLLLFNTTRMVPGPPSTGVALAMDGCMADTGTQPVISQAVSR